MPFLHRNIASPKHQEAIPHFFFRLTKDGVHRVCVHRPLLNSVV